MGVERFDVLASSGFHGRVTCPEFAIGACPGNVVEHCPRPSEHV